MIRKWCLILLLIGSVALSQTSKYDKPFIYDPTAIMSYHDITLLSPLSEVKSHFQFMEMSDRAFDITSYNAKMENETLEWRLSFLSLGAEDPILIQLGVHTNGTLDNWYKIVTHYMQIIQSPVRLSEPSILPLYSAIWDTGSGNTITQFSIVFNPEVNRLIVLLDIDQLALSGTSIQELLEELKRD